MASKLARLEERKRILQLEIETQALRLRKEFIDKECKRIRRFEAASKTKRTQGWTTPGSSGPISSLSPALSILRERSRDLIQNTGYGESAVTTIVSGMVGYGVTVSINNKRLAALWKTWAEDSEQCDARQRQRMGGLQAQVVRSWVESGEILFRKVIRKNWKPGEHPYAIQVIEPDLLDTTKENRALRLRQGIEFDEYGAPVAYWLYPEHPVEGMGMKPSERIPASDVGHMFFEKRPGQIRGYPLFTPIIIKMHDLGDFEDAQLMRQKLAACFMAFVTNIEGESADVRKEADELYEKLTPGIIQPLRIGESVEFANPPSVTGYKEYTGALLHGVAAGIGVTYEDLTGDFSMVNWSSGRLGRLKYYANLDTWQWLMLIPMFCDKVWRWFLEGAEFLGIPTKSATVKYTLPRRPVADLNEYRARRDEVRSGFKSIPEAIRENGYEEDAIIEENKRFLTKADAAGQVYDCDPRRISGFGQGQPYQAEAGIPPLDGKTADHSDTSTQGK